MNDEEIAWQRYIEHCLDCQQCLFAPSHKPDKHCRVGEPLIAEWKTAADREEACALEKAT